MQLSHSRRFIFIHICKTAGTSVLAALEPYTERPERRPWNRLRRRLGFPAPPPYPGLSPHARAAEVRAALPADVFRGYFKFAFVRNPWDWQVSWYHYVLQNPAHHEHDAVRRLAGFRDYLRWRADHPVVPQKEFVTDAAGRLLVDFVGRFEALRADFGHVCRRVGIRAALCHLNRSRHADYRSYYDDRSRALVAEQFREDIAYFGYAFEPARAARVAA